MEHLVEIGWFLSWPLFICISYLAVKFTLKKFNLLDEEK